MEEIFAEKLEAFREHSEHIMIVVSASRLVVDAGQLLLTIRHETKNTLADSRQPSDIVVMVGDCPDIINLLPCNFYPLSNPKR